MIRTLMIGLAALGLLTPLKASNCAGYSRTYSYSTPTKSYAVASHPAPYAAHAYKDEVVYNKFLAVVPLVAYPTYSAVYAPPVAPYGSVLPNPLNQDPAKQQQAQGELAQVLKGLTEVTASLRDLDGRLRRLEQAQGLPAPQQLPKQEAPRQQSQAPKGQHTFASVNARACAMCHQKGSESHGGDFVLSDAGGAIVKLTDAQAGAMSRVLLKGKMPKLNARAKEHGLTAPLTAEEAQALLAEVDKQLSN